MVELLVCYSMRKTSTLVLSLISDFGWIGAICSNIHFSGLPACALYGPTEAGEQQFTLRSPVRSRTATIDTQRTMHSEHILQSMRQSY